VPTPREVFAVLAELWLNNPNASSFPQHLLADDVVVEMPLAPAGWPNRIAGRRQFVVLAEAGRSAVPVRFHDCRNVVIHETAEPEIIVAEYELAGTATTTGQAVAASFIAVLAVRDGRIAHWREYHNVPAVIHQLAVS